MLMEEKNYNSINEDSRFQDLTKMLQELPKIKAEDNFEFNLLAKIKNGNYDAKKYKESHVGWTWIYAPATALLLSAILIFFVFNPESEEFDNPLMANPPLRTLNTPDTMMTNFLSKAETQVAQNEKPAKQNSDNSNKSKTEESYVVVLQPNDVVVREKMPYPFEEGVDIDNYVGQSGLQGQGGGQLANYGENYFEFDGFFIRVKPNKELILREKARLDSLRKSLIIE